MSFRTKDEQMEQFCEDVDDTMYGKMNNEGVDIQRGRIERGWECIEKAIREAASKNCPNK